MIVAGLVIPLLTAAMILLLNLVRPTHRPKPTPGWWWKMLLTFPASLASVGACGLMADYAQTRDTEYWTGWVVSGEHGERWDELHEWDEEYTEQVADGTEIYSELDSKGKSRSKTRTKYRTVSRTRHHRDIIDHPAYWSVTDSNKQVVYISAAEWEALAKKFSSRAWEGHHSGYSLSGDVYGTKWDGKDETIEVVSTAHTYENRVLASESVFNYRKIDKEEKGRYGLYDYPPIVGLHQDAILGASDPAAERKLEVLNAKLGKEKQVRVWVLVFRDQPMDAAVAQESYWVGGNKNELVLCVGVDKENEVQWGYVFSWTENQTCKLEARDLITDQKKLDLPKLVEKLEPVVRNNWERKHFKDFSYLTVEPPTWAVALSCFVIVLANGGVFMWAVGGRSDDRG